MTESAECLIDKTCKPCQGGVPSLSKEAVEDLLKQLKSSWTLNIKGHIYKEFKFPDFMSAMAFSNRIANVAEREGHHPDLKIGWGLCAVEIWTHKIEGLTESDFILAAKIEAEYDK